MAQATWNGAVIADSDDTVVVEGNHYFPPSSVNWDLLTPSSKQTTCPWKGVANYYDITVDGKTNRSAVWQYQTPKSAARNIQGHVAFWGGVRVSTRRAAPEHADERSASEAPVGLLRRLFAGGR